MKAILITIILVLLFSSVVSASTDTPDAKKKTYLPNVSGAGSRAGNIYLECGFNEDVILHFFSPAGTPTAITVISWALPYWIVPPTSGIQSAVWDGGVKVMRFHPPFGYRIYRITWAAIPGVTLIWYACGGMQAGDKRWRPKMDIDPYPAP